MMTLKWVHNIIRAGGESMSNYRSAIMMMLVAFGASVIVALDARTYPDLSGVFAVFWVFAIISASLTVYLMTRNRSG